MRVMSASKSKDFPFDVDVMDPMLGVVLDTDLGSDLSRDGCAEGSRRVSVLLLLVTWVCACTLLVVKS